MKKTNRLPQPQGLNYAQRMQMQRYQTIAQQRDDAAITALMLACVALNDTEHLGPVRIQRFAKRLNQLTSEFYADRETGTIQLQRRLQQIGFDDSLETIERISAPGEEQI
ncbi:hypothetical protein [Caproiciproducens sp.]